MTICNAVEKQKLKMDGLEIFDKISRYAETGFDSIPKKSGRCSNGRVFTCNAPGRWLFYDAGVCALGVANPGRASGNLGRNCQGLWTRYDITTRQAVQFHWLRIEQIPDIFQRLEKVGLSTAGACGDITRNIVGNPLAGIDPDELLDTTWIVKDLFVFYIIGTFPICHANIRCLSVLTWGMRPMRK